MAFEKELRIALEAASQAAERIRRDYESFVPIPDAPASISTETDRASQEIILQHLCHSFPDDALCAEEATPTLASAKREAPRMWIVDPIDGTRGFVTKNGEFSVMIGLVVNRQLAVGVVLEPVLDRVTYATFGGGCWTRVGDEQPTPCRVSQVDRLSNASLVQSHSRSKEPAGPVKALQPARLIEKYSAGVKLALVARGEGELYVNTYPQFHDWDICAGHLLVTEAGGSVTTLKGEAIGYGAPGHKQFGGLLATNGKVHAEAVRLLSAVA